MVRYCCICKVESGANEDVSIHIIPKSEDLKVKWFVNIGRKVCKYSGVCSRHFEAKDFQYKVVGDTVKRFLVPGAIPTLLLTQSNRENVLSHDIEITSSSQITLLSTKSSGETVLLDSHHQLQANKDSNTILADVTNTNLQDISYSCVEVAESENVKVAVHVKTQDNIEQSSSDSIHYDSNNGNTNSAVTEHEFYSEIVNDNCNELNIPIDSECSNEKTALKRKSNEPMKGAKHLCNPRYIGDLRREDFTSEISWKIFHEYVKTSKSQCKVLNQKIKRLNKKVETLKSLLDHLKKNGLLSNEACNALEVSY